MSKSRFGITGEEFDVVNDRCEGRNRRDKGRTICYDMEPEDGIAGCQPRLTTSGLQIFTRDKRQLDVVSPRGIKQPLNSNSRALSEDYVACRTLVIKSCNVASPLDVENIIFGMSNSTTGVFFSSFPTSVSISCNELTGAHTNRPLCDLHYCTSDQGSPPNCNVPW